MPKIDIRRGKIMERLKREGAVSVSVLAAELGATPVTIRNDLDALEKDGYLIRVQGGAMRKPSVHEDTFPQVNASVAHGEEKIAIARELAKRIRDGDTLFINSGTTMQVVAAALKSHKNLNIVTNAVKVALEMGAVPTFRVILLGGEVNAQYGFTYGSDVQEQLSHYQADWALLTLDGIGTTGELTTYHAEEAPLNRMMIARAKQVMIAADHSKLGKAGFFRFGKAQPGMQLLTDGKIDPAVLSALRQSGVEVIFAGA